LISALVGISWKNVNIVSDVRQIEVHKAEPLVAGPNCLEVGITIAELKYKLPGSDQILAELIQAVGKTLLSVIHKLVNPIWKRKNCLISGNSLLLYQFTKKGDKMVCNNYRGISLLSTSYKLSNALLSRLSSHIDEIIGDHQCGF
jgi:hypothetical protein